VRARPTRAEGCSGRPNPQLCTTQADADPSPFLALRRLPTGFLAGWNGAATDQFIEFGSEKEARSRRARWVHTAQPTLIAPALQLGRREAVDGRHLSATNRHGSRCVASHGDLSQSPVTRLGTKKPSQRTTDDLRQLVAARLGVARCSGRVGYPGDTSNPACVTERPWQRSREQRMDCGVVRPEPTRNSPPATREDATTRRS
jgi:hypothetical protein